VLVGNNAALNAYPITVSVWFRTTNSAALFQAIVSKYFDNTGDGFFLLVQQGRLRGFYSAGGFGNTAMDATSAATVADGFWHHAAMSVDASGGTLYLDGVRVGSGAWAAPAAPTTTAPLLFGAYSVTASETSFFFQGSIDEVTLWNRALGAAEINYLKHRQLNGNEDGLAGLWGFDEGAGATARDATLHGYDGTLQNNPAWIASTAPLVFNQVAGTALKFSGATDSECVTVPHDPALNALPLTVMAWVRTSRNAAQADGIVSKYADASGDGYSMFLYNGHLRAWYFYDWNDYVWDQGFGIDGGAIADGQWHHVALVVDAISGRLYVDGAQTGFLDWINSAGASTSTDPLQIGEYSTYANSLDGLADEVSLWNVALTPGQLATYKNAPLTGSEAGLVALWRLNEGSGTTAHDLTGNGHDGTLVNGPVWTGSTAFLGDGTSAINATLGAVQWTREFAVKTIPAQRGFGASAPFWVRRLDDFGAPAGNTSVTLTLQTSLQSAPLGGPEPLVNNSSNFDLTLQPFLAAAPALGVGGVVQSPALVIEPDPNTQLDSVKDSFQLGVAESYAVNTGPQTITEAVILSSTPLMHFDGHLLFGPVDTIFTALVLGPTRGAASGGGISTALNVLTGALVNKPDHAYGNGAPINAILMSNGDAIALGSTPLAGPAPDTDSIGNISFTRSNEELTPTGASASIVLNLPLGLSLSSSTGNHLTTSQASLGTLNLDGNLQPTDTALTISGPTYVIEETLPFWFAAPAVTWQVHSGQIVMNPTGGTFVRQQEDDLLTAAAPGLVEPNTANRISNDGYLRGSSLASASLVVAADTNGAALITAQLALNPPELRPHFPYTSNAPGAQIPTGSGLLAITNNLADPASYLTVGLVPVLYGRDCVYTNCTAGRTGPAELDFTPATGQLNFTPDGGLLGFGSVPAATLQWGYAAGGNFAQQAGLVAAGAFCMAGTFLHSDQTSAPDPQRAAVLLFSGFGDAADPSYFERPWDTNYSQGLANYAGLNFRSPAQGQSYIGQSDSGPYALDPVSKYYVRFGGVSGIHQAQAGSFPSGMSLYGYAFTFTDFGLSYLDGQNQESVTTGAVAFPPQPAGFTQPFDRMTLTCRGDLLSATVPAGSGVDHLAYWNVDFTPLSIDFHPTNNDVCGNSPRFLAMAAEIKLPFIPQALHATLGFLTNGNLVTVSDNVTNVDSRFVVPGQLSLQGPGNTMFTLSTCAEGYFNNWATPGAAALPSGFFNLAGKLATPFFGDIKVHLHVTPITATNAQIDIMGGWPAPGSPAPDQGWGINNSNFFNMVNFDPHSDGWPQGMDIAAYRNSPNTQYRPRAQKDWMGVATFDYPLKWDGALRRFEGFLPNAPVQLPIINVDSRLKELAPGKVDFDFAQDISVQLPQIKVLDFVNDALDGDIGPLQSVSNAVYGVLSQALDVTGLNELQAALREDAQTFFNPILANAIDPRMQPLLAQMAAHSQANVPLFLQQVYGDITAPTGPLATGITTLNNITNQASSVVLTLDKTLTDVLATAGLLDRILAKDPASGQRQAVTKIVEQLVHDQSGALNIVASLTDDEINPLLADIDSTLAEIQSDIEDASNQVAQVKAQLDDTSGEFNQALASVLADGTELKGVLQAAAANVTNYLAGALTPAGDLFTANPAAVQQAIRQQIVTAFLSSVLTANYQTAFRQFLGDDNVLLDQLMNVLFDQINSTIRNALVDAISGATDGIPEAMKGAGLLGGNLFSAKIRGAPTFDGDSLRDIHLNADMQMNMPDKMSFSAYMDIAELTSQSAPVACVPNGDPAVEITLGAKNVPLGWGGADGQSLTLSAEARWTLQGDPAMGQAVSVIGLGGSLVIGGGVSFEGVSLKELGATLAVGANELYFATKVDCTVPIVVPVDMQAGLFVGQACTLDPLKFVDPDVEQVLVNSQVPFSGVYVEFGGGLSLSEILGYSSAGCVLDLRASITTAYYWQGGASFGTIGGRQKMAVDASLFCALNGHADWAGLFALDSATHALTVGGEANVCGSIGPCPVCFSGCKGVTVVGTASPQGLHYAVHW
jgi:hypothetical protein